MKSVRAVEWITSDSTKQDVMDKLYDIYFSGTKFLGVSDRYEVKMIICKPDGREKSLVNQEKLDFEGDK